MYKKLLCILLTITGLLSLTACWDHVEISEMLIIAGIGLDVDRSGELFHATVEFINVEAEGGENIKAGIVEGCGDTLHGAIQNAMLMTGGTIFGNHCKVIVIGDRLARMGVDEAIELILRSPDFRKTVDLLVAKDSTAKSVLKQKTVKNDIVSYELSKILDSNQKSIKNTVATGVYQLHDILISDCAFFVVPTVYARQNNGESVLQVDGCAVFAGERLQGFLDGEQSKLFNMVTHNNRSMTIAIEDADISSAPIDVNITQSNVHLRPYLQGEALSMRVDIAAKASLENAVLPDIDPAERQRTEQMENIIGEQLSAGVKKLVRDVQSLYASDIFEFYREYQDVYRQEWAGLQQDWRSHFRDMEITVASDVQITGSGLVGNYAPGPADRDNANALP